MIIDCHTHLEFYADKQYGANQLIDSMKKGKIEKALVYAGEMFNCSNEKLLKEVNPFRKKLFPVGSVSPFSKTRPTPQQVEKLLSSGEIFGLKFYNGYEHFYPSDDILKPYLALLEKFGLPAVFHSGDTWNQVRGAKLRYAHPLNFDDLAVDMPNLKIIIAHIGNPWTIDAAEVVYKNKNVYVDCSGLVHDYIKAEDKILLKRLFSDYFLFGGSVDKVLFGTDWNLCDQNDYANFFSRLFRSRSEKKKIFYENSIKVFKLQNYV